MQKLQRVRTRRQLLRATAVSAASIPFLAVTRKSASAQNNNHQGNNNNNQGNNNQGNNNQGNNNQGNNNQGNNNQGNNNQGSNTWHPCFLKGTKISTPSSDRLVQDLQIGDEVQTLAGRKTIKWIGYNKFTKEEGRAWHGNVMPIRVARFAIDDRIPHRDLYLSPRRRRADSSDVSDQ
jgi:Hint domain-containing protein